MLGELCVAQVKSQRGMFEPCVLSLKVSGILTGESANWWSVIVAKDVLVVLHGVRK